MRAARVDYVTVMSAPHPSLEQYLRTIPLFSLLEPTDAADLLRLLRPVTLEAGQVLFKQGDPGGAMWVLGEGVEVSVSSTPRDGGRSVVVAYARAGDTLGEMSLVDEGPRSGTAVVMQGGPAHQIDALDFLSLREARFPAAYKVLRKICVDLCRKLRATTDRIVPSSQRIIEAPPVDETRRADPGLIDDFPAFKALPEVVKLALAQKLSVIDLPSVQPIFGEGERADAAYFVLQGQVSVGRNGRTLTTLGPGAMFGLVSCIDEGRRAASCVSTGPAILLRLKDADFDSLFAKGNRFAFEVVEVVARQLVTHLREANELLPRPGSPAPRMPIDLTDADILPLELELELA